MFKNLLQILFFLPFALSMIAFAIVGRLINRIEDREFFGKNIILAILGSLSIIGVVLLVLFGKVYE